MYARRYDEVIRLLRKTLETSPTEPIALSTIRSAYHQKKMYDEALGSLEALLRGERGPRGHPGSQQWTRRGGILPRLAEAGGDAHRAIENVVRDAMAGGDVVYAGRDEGGSPRLAGQAYAAHDPNMPYLSVDPIFDDLRDQPRFQAILKSMGLVR